MENPAQSDLATVLQLVIDHEDLQQYYHVAELPDRKPLRVAKTAAVEAAPALTKFGVPVVYEDADAASGTDRALFEFQRVVVDPHLAYVKFAYGAEGVAGEAWLIKEDGHWRVGPFTAAEQ